LNYRKCSIYNKPETYFKKLKNKPETVTGKQKQYFFFYQIQK